MNYTKQIKNVLGLCEVQQMAIHPKGEYLAACVRCTNWASNEYDHLIMMKGPNDKSFHEICRGTDPSWSPNGAYLSFLSENGEAYTYCMETQSRKKCFTVYPSHYFINHTVKQSMIWAPDSNSIAFVSASGPNQMDQEPKIESTGLLYRTKGGRGRTLFAGQEPMDIYIYDIQSESVEQMTKVTGHIHNLTWSPDGGSIAFLGNLTEKADFNQNVSIWVLDLNERSTERLPVPTPCILDVQWSPCGNHLAYLGIENALATNDSTMEDTQLYTCESNGDNARVLSQEVDRRVMQFEWSTDGKSLFFMVESHGRTPILKVMTGGESPYSVFEHHDRLHDFTMDDRENVIHCISSGIAQPPEILEHRLSDENHSHLSTFSKNDHLAPQYHNSEEFWFLAKDGEKIQGWITKPNDLKNRQQCPLVLVIHGGPHNMFGFEFEDRVQILASAGYAVLRINPRGSSGYGQSFSAGNRNDWGGKDHEDLMSGLDHCIGRHPWIDADRLGVTGQSYGGYLTNWIVTQTNRFKAAVSDGGISNLISFSGTSIFHSLVEADFDGDIYNKYPLLWDRSPLKHIKNVQTPLLLLHGEIDYEVPLGQSEEFHRALAKCGKKSKLIFYRGEGHGWRPSLRPNNKLDLFRNMLQWFDEHLKK